MSGCFRRGSEGVPYCLDHLWRARLFDGGTDVVRLLPRSAPPRLAAYHGQLYQFISDSFWLWFLLSDLYLCCYHWAFISPFSAVAYLFVVTTSHIWCIATSTHVQ